MDQVKGNSVLTKHFTNEQLDHLIGVLNYMDSIVLEGNVTKKRIDKHYWANLNLLLSANYHIAPFFAPDNGIDQIAALDKKLFDKIWRFRTVHHTHEGYLKDSVLVFEHKLTNSTYLNMLKELEQSNENLKDYVWSVTAAGDFSLQITYRGYHNFNVSNPIERLIISIDILTYNIPHNYCYYEFIKYNRIHRLKRSIENEG